MRINIDITQEGASYLGVLAATEKTDRKNYIQNVLEAHARNEYSKLVIRETKKIKSKLIKAPETTTKE